jgi:hypothetical protein
MNKIEDRNTVQSAEQTAGANKSRKSQSLRLEKQTIRTLTGAELHLVGGGKCDTSLGSCALDVSFLSLF